MMQHPLPSSLIRKSPYGRTQLFLHNPSVRLREVRCMGGIERHDHANVYHLLPVQSGGSDGVTCCWHCCEPLASHGNTTVPLPSMYDPADEVYYVYGRTCSPGCAKAYIVEHSTFNRGQHLNLLMKMLRGVYGVSGPVVETPPRQALARFGGIFDARSIPKTLCRLVNPPFVSYCMVIEEHGAPQSALPNVPSQPVEEEDDELLDEPHPPAMFHDFGQRRAAAAQPQQNGCSSTTRRGDSADNEEEDDGEHARTASSRTAADSEPSRRKGMVKGKRPPPSVNGPMSRFCK